MLRLAYLAMLYWWYGGSLSSLSEEVTDDSSDQHQHNAIATGSAAHNTSEGNGAPERSNTSPAPASGSQLQQPPTKASAAELRNAGRGAQPNTEHTQGASSGERDHEELQKLLKRASIKDKLTALTVLTSIVSDLDLFADWYFFEEGLQGESRVVSEVALAFAVVGTVMYVLVAVEFHFVSKIRALCRGGEPLDPLQHVPLGWQLLLNVVVEDVPQLVITWITSPTSVAGVLNIATAGFALLAKTAEGFESRHDLPVSALLRMVEEDPGVVRRMAVPQREAEEQAANAASLAVLVNQFRQSPSSDPMAAERRQGIALGVMRLDPGFLNGKLNYIWETLEVSVLKNWNSLQKGDIPSELGNLSRLKVLALDCNQLEGPIPTELGNLGALTRLDLHNNKLNGPIPTALGHLGALAKLDLHSNKLNRTSGTIPPELGGLMALQKLDVSYNQLAGTIPPELGGLTALQALSLSSNQLTGTIPTELGGLTALQKLDLSDNQLTGTIPRELGGLTALEELYLAHNQLTGTIPPELGGLAALQVLYLYNNQLTGSVPGELRQLKAPSIAKFAENNFTGTEAEVKRLFPADCDVQWDLSKDSCMSRCLSSC